MQRKEGIQRRLRRDFLDVDLHTVKSSQPGNYKAHDVRYLLGEKKTPGGALMAATSPQSNTTYMKPILKDRLLSVTWEKPGD